ncbi:Uncharacterised protein [uncultured Clostridium sp.]|nr:Uncharacterised protein [uncultured Clostridium sp.]
MSKSELRSSGKQRSCDFANGAGELTAVDARFFHPPVRTKASVR